MKAKRFENAREAPAPAGASLSIGGVADATGISVDTLRVWERRYGRPTATRLPSGHRRYSQDQVRHLRRISEGLALGHRPSELLPLSKEELDAVLGASPAHGLDEYTAQLLEHVRDFDRAELTEMLHREWNALDPVTFLESRMKPLLVAVGRLWADGDLEIRHEHFVTEVLDDVLRALRMAIPDAPPTWSAVLATLPGETHDLGLQMLALLCALKGVATHILGADTPVGEIARMQRETEAQAVMVSVSLATGGVATDRLLTDLRARLPADVHLLVGGSGARGPRRGARGVVYVSDLGTLADWLEAVSREAA